ncbi:MAG: HD domain-containing protein [Holosporales bacterium]|jgi:putative nucleotidyltransferase with HDIG domain|nr:HD domain-containing protein [Holosporales bacterium]
MLKIFNKDPKLFKHSVMVARAAEIIVQKIPDFDSQKAYAFGLFHDIGKLNLDKNDAYKHPRLGYEMLKDEHPDIANICISHPFPVFENINYIKYYCHNDHEETTKIIDILKNIKENDLYIKIIQFCDKISESARYVKLETKFKIYAEKYNIDSNIIKLNLIKLNSIKIKLDKITGYDIYNVLNCI